MSEQYDGEERRQIPRTPVSEVCYKKYGITTSTRARQITTVAGKQELVRGNPNRVSMILVNNSDTIVYINFNLDVSSDFGVPLAANGGSFGMTLDDEGEAVCATIYAYCSTAGKYLTLLETVVGG